MGNLLSEECETTSRKGAYLKKALKLAYTRKYIYASAPVILILLVPLTKDLRLMRILTTASIYAIYAASWDLLSYSGQISFGHAAFFGVGSLIVAVLNTSFGVPTWAAMPIAGFFALGTGLIIGFPCLRLRGPYFILATFVFAMVLYSTFLHFRGIYGGGGGGIYGIDPLHPTPTYEYYIIIVLMLAAIFMMYKVAKSKVGLIFRTISDDEVAAQAIGTNTTKYKIIAFCISTFIAGIAGGLYAVTMRSIVPEEMFGFDKNLLPLIFAVVGGFHTIFGSLIGAYTLIIFGEYLRFTIHLRLLTYTTLVLLIIRFLPEGIAVRAYKSLTLAARSVRGASNTSQPKSEN